MGDEDLEREGVFERLGWSDRHEMKLRNNNTAANTGSACQAQVRMDFSIHTGIWQSLECRNSEVHLQWSLLTPKRAPP